MIAVADVSPEDLEVMEEGGKIFSPEDPPLLLIETLIDRFGRHPSNNASLHRDVVAIREHIKAKSFRLAAKAGPTSGRVMTAVYRLGASVLRGRRPEEFAEDDVAVVAKVRAYWDRFA